MVVYGWGKGVNHGWEGVEGLFRGVLAQGKSICNYSPTNLLLYLGECVEDDACGDGDVEGVFGAVLGNF